MAGSGSVNHNGRKFHAKNTDLERSCLNVEYCNENIKDVYHELFDEVLSWYNEKQTGNDRIIDDYYEKICSGKQEKPFHEIMLQHGIEWEKKGTHEKNLSELSATNLLLKEQMETLTEDKKKLLSENEKFEKQQKKLQRELNKMVQSKEVMERSIHAYDEDVKWQLPEPGALMSAKAYLDKKALLLGEKLKEVVKNLTIKCVQLTEQSKELTAKVDGQQKQISRLTDKEVQNLIDWVCLSEQIKENNNTIRNLTGEYKKIEPDCREGVWVQLECLKELCKERNNLYEKQNDLKEQKRNIRMIVNVGRGGCYALYFLMENGSGIIKIAY